MIVLIVLAAIVVAAFFGTVVYAMAQDGWWVPVLCWGTAIVVTAAIGLLVFTFVPEDKGQRCHPVANNMLLCEKKR